MPSVVIDLRTKVIPASLQIWRLFPGSSYAFLPSFEKEGAVFLDFPGLVLPPGPVTEDLADLEDRIVASRALREWAWVANRARREGREPPPAPSRDPAAHSDARRPRGIASDKGAVAGLFGRPAKGDLVVVPGPISSRTVRVGEFLDGPDRRVGVKLERYGDEVVPARRVRWFPPINELELPERVSEVIRRPNPFVAFDKTQYTEIFDRTFGTYVFGDEYSARFDTKSARFTANDNLDLMLLAEAIATLVESSQIGVDVSRFGHLWQLAVQPKSAEYKSDLSININSPGSILFKSKSLVPLVFAAFFALASGVASAGEVPGSVTVVNSASTEETDLCTPQVDERVRAALQLMQIEVWREACERSVRLRQQPEMVGRSTVSPPQVPGAAAAGPRPQTPR
jgi:hypothetical protein